MSLLTLKIWSILEGQRECMFPGAPFLLHNCLPLAVMNYYFCHKSKLIFLADARIMYHETFTRWLIFCLRHTIILLILETGGLLQALTGVTLC